jgi:hypothetical protein
MTEQADFEGRKEWSKQELFSLRNRIEHDALSATSPPS